MRRRVRELGWGALGFAAALLLFVVGSALWGIHIEHRIDRITVQRVVPHRLRPLHRPEARANSVPDLESHEESAGPAPSTGGVPDTGAPAVPDDVAAPAPHKPSSRAPKTPPSPAATETPTSSSPAASSPATAPEPTPPPAEAEPEAPAPALLSPALTRVCSVVDRLAHLC